MKKLQKIFILVLLHIAAHAVAQQEVQLAVQTGHSSAIVHLAFSNDGRTLASAGADNKVVVWDIAKHKQKLILSGHQAMVSSVVFHPNKPWIATASINGQIFIRDLTNGGIIGSFQVAANESIGLDFDNTGQNLFVASNKLVQYNTLEFSISQTGIEHVKFVKFNNDNSQLALVNNSGDVMLYKAEDFTLIKKYNGSFAKVAFSTDDSYLYGAGMNGVLKRWNLQGSNLFKGMTITANRIWDSYYDVSVNDTHFIGANRDKLVYVRNHRTGKLVNVLKAHNGEVRALGVSPDGKLLATAGLDRSLLIWSIESGKLLSELKGVSNRINDVVYGASGKSIAIAYDDGSLRTTILDESMSTRLIRQELSGWERLMGYEIAATAIRSYDEEQSVEFTLVKRKRSKKLSKGNQFKKIATCTGTWSLINESLELGKWQAATLPSEPKISGFDTEIALIRQDTLILGTEIIKTYHADRITAVARNPVYNQFITASWDGMIKIWDNQEKALALNYSAMATSDYILTDPNNYYFATKGALRGVGFFVKGEVLSFDQFDTKYNRPDLVFSRLPYIEPTLIANYKQAYDKRLSKLNLNLEDLDYSGEIPQLSIVKEDLDYVTKNRSYSFAILGQAKSSPLERLHISVNGVPTYGPEGKAINNLKLIDQTLEITLNPGRNEIVVYATNSNGISSYRDIISVNCQARVDPPQLYLVAIGASKFQMSEYNLTYAAKDARDISREFKRNKYFEKVNTLEIIDTEVTVASLSKIESFVSKAGFEDVVIITVAGHGVLSENLDYYLATYDMDFAKPAAKGIAYQDLEAILERTQSRQKSLILDACHSGELDKEELELSAKAAKIEGGVQFRAVGADVSYKKQSGMKSSFALSKQLFADMRSNNGATIISSAGAAEYAFEGNEWSNGLFTYVMLEGLRSNKADLNEDGIIMLSELQKYLFAEVPRMSGGLQTPTSRVENLNNDFRIK